MLNHAKHMLDDLKSLYLQGSGWALLAMGQRACCAKPPEAAAEEVATEAEPEPMDLSMGLQVTTSLETAEEIHFQVHDIIRYTYRGSCRI